MSAAFKPCTPCAYRYKRVYAFGGNRQSSGGGLFPNDKTDFIACYNSAIALVNSIDISTVPWGGVRYFDYGGITATKSDSTYIDHGNIVNNPTNLPGDSLGNAPMGTGDYGAIVGGGSELSYMGLDNPLYGVNAGGYQSAAWFISYPTLGSAYVGIFAVSRIQVDLSMIPCATKWSSVQWDPQSSPTPGCLPTPCYNFKCDCDATTYGSCPTCENASNDTNALCIDIPTSLAPGFTAQADPDLPCFSRYFVPGFNCSDLT